MITRISRVFTLLGLKMSNHHIVYLKTNIANKRFYTNYKKIKKVKKIKIFLKNFCSEIVYSLIYF